jgi:hypothetical protein
MRKTYFSFGKKCKFVPTEFFIDNNKSNLNDFGFIDNLESCSHIRFLGFSFSETDKDSINNNVAEATKEETKKKYSLTEEEYVDIINQIKSKLDTDIDCHLCPTQYEAYMYDL